MKFWSALSLLFFGQATPLLRAGRTRSIGASDALPVGDWFYSASGDEVLEEVRRGGRVTFRMLVLKVAPSLKHFFVLSVVAGLGLVGAPYFVRQVLLALERSKPYEALPIVGALFLVLFVATLSRQHLFDGLQRGTTACRTLLQACLYGKVLRAHSGSYRDESSESVLNLLGDDTRRVAEIFLHGENFLMTPLILLGGVFGLWMLVGVASLSGILVLVLTLLLSYFIGELRNRYKRRALKCSDQRVDLIDEVLKGILSVKFYSWEGALKKEIEQLREEEVKELRVIVALSSIGPSLQIGAPLIAALAAFSLYAAQGNLLTASVIFPALALFGVIRNPLSSIPHYVNALVEARLGLERINHFLSRNEVQGRQEHTSLARGAIHCADLVTQWTDGERSIGPISLEIQPGELVCIVGKVGSGKSAFLRSLLGEISAVSGRYESRGSLAYVPQRPWIVNATVGENITFGAAPDTQRVHAAVAATGLAADINSFQGRLDEEIGERGINLSGGQKQRVSLARADYSESDIVLLDDPLSALDPSVADEVYRTLILSRWKDRTRLLVTHRIEYCRHAQRILVLEDGKIVAEGTFAELRAHSDTFRALSEHLAHESGQDNAHGRKEVVSSVDGEVGEAVALIQGDEEYVGAVRKEVFRNYFKRAFPFATAIGLILICVVREGFGISTDLWMAWWSSQSTLDFNLFLSVYALFVFMTIALSYARFSLIGTRALVAVNEYHHGVLGAVLRAPMRFFESTNIGRIVNRFSYDIATVEQDVPLWLKDSLGSLLTAATALLLICTLYPKFLLVIPLLVLAHYFLIKDYRPVGRQLGRLNTRTRGPIFAQMSETLSGIEVIRAASQVAQFNRKFFQKLRINADVYYTTVVVNRWLGSRTEILSAFVVGVASLIPSIETTRYGPGFAGLVMASAVSIGGAVSWFIRSLTSLETSLNSAERLEHYMGIEPEKWEGIDPPAGWPQGGKVTFRNVSARYRASSPVILNGLDFEVQPGEKIGIVGRTGGGKSTIFLAMMRILELSQGTICIDDQDISKLSLRTLRRVISIIPQEPMMFRGTLRRNLDPFEEFSDDDLWQVLRRAHCESFVRELHGGLLSPIASHGANLSVGQRQLIALARSLLRRTPIVLLDEATANIDPFTDRLVQQTVRDEFQHATVIAIAHRVSSLSRYDRILVIEQGRATRSGPPSELDGHVRELLG